MKIIYHSLTGNIEKFLTKINHECDLLRLSNGKEIIDKSFVLITYTIGNGDIPCIINDFMVENHKYCKGLIGSGNRNWGKNYCGSVFKLKDLYNIPVLMTFETSGTKKDIIKFHDILKEVNDL